MRLPSLPLFSSVPEINELAHNSRFFFARIGIDPDFQKSHINARKRFQEESHDSL